MFRGKACIQHVLKVKDKVKGHVIRAFRLVTKTAISHRQIARSPPSIHTKVPRRVCTQSVLKVTVKVKGHVIRALLSCHKKSLILACKLLDCHETCTQWSPPRPASRVCLRSRSRSEVTRYGHFRLVTKTAISHRQMARSPPNIHTKVPGQVCTCLLYTSDAADE